MINSGSTGEVVRVNGGTAAMSIATHLSQTGTGRVADVSSHGTNNVTLSGSLCTGTLSVGNTVCTASGSSTGINVASNTGGTILFSGALKKFTTGASAAVTLATNTGTTINFSNGGLDINTTSGKGFDATGGATALSVTGSGNSITSTTGTALNVNATTIGANGLTFRSISAGTGAGSAGNGINLDTTGSNAGLTVTGTGSAASGGTIQHKTGADGNSAAGIGIYLNSTKNASFNWMQMNDFDNFAIRGSNVDGFVFDNSVISGISGSVVNASDEAAIRFGGTLSSDPTGLFGSASISNSNISGGYEYVIKILNNSGVLNRLTIDNTTIGANHDAASGNGGDAFQLVTHNSATSNVTVTDSIFTSAGADLFNAAADNAANMDVVFRNNNVSNNHANQAGASSNVLVFSTSTGAVSYDISHNTVVADTVSAIANTSNGIAVAKGVPDSGSGGTMTGTVNANTIGQSGVTGSGSAFTGIFASALGSGTHTTAITNNIIYHYNEEGIFLKANDNLTGGNSVLNATVTGNQTLQPDSLAFAGIWIVAGSGSGTENQIVNVVLGSSGTPGLQNDFTNGDPANFSDVEIQELGSNSAINLHDGRFAVRHRCGRCSRRQRWHSGRRFLRYD